MWLIYHCVVATVCVNDPSVLFQQEVTFSNYDRAGILSDVMCDERS